MQCNNCTATYYRLLCNKLFALSMTITSVFCCLVCLKFTLLFTWKVIYLNIFINSSLN